ncbi:unnamed protein product [Peniophora sp. CBMAI 1063]|nr:unnamed protein product [Peniophora sp. CBMAI 1063]
MSRNTSAEAAASSAPRKGPSTYSLFSADSSEDLLDGLEDFPLVPDTSLVHATTSVPYDNANDSLKDAFLEMGSPAASTTPGSQGVGLFAHEQQVYLDQQSMSERDGIERPRLHSETTVTQVFVRGRAASSYADNARVSPHVMSPSSTASSYSSTPSTPQLPNVAVGTRNPTSPPWDPSSYASDTDVHPQGGFEMAARSSQRSSRSGPFIQHKRSNQHISRQDTAPPSPTTVPPSMSGSRHTHSERPVGSMISAYQPQGEIGRQDIRHDLTSALDVLHAERRHLPAEDIDELYDDFDPSKPFTRMASEESYAQPPSPTMTVFSSLDDDLLPDFLDLDGDDASSRQSHTSSRPFSILPGVVETNSERSTRADGNVFHPNTTPLPRAPATSTHTHDQVPTSTHNRYADPVIPTMQPAPGPRKAQSLSNLAGQASQRPLYNRPVLQHSASSQRLYDHARTSPLGGADFSKPLPMAPPSHPDGNDHSRASSSQPNQPVSRSRRVSPLSPLSESHPFSAHMGVPSHSPEPSSQSESRPRALSSLDMQAINNAQQRLHHSASRESGLTGTASSRSRSSTTSSWDFVPRKKVDPAIPPELAASRIPGTASMLTPPITRQNFSPTETSRPSVHRILQQHGISGGRPEYSPTASSFEQSISRRGSTRSASARSTASSGSSQNAIDGTQSKGSGLSDLRHKISGLLRPTQDLSPRSPEFESLPSPGMPKRQGKGSNEGSFTAPPTPGLNGHPMRSRALSKKSSEQLAPPHSPRTNAMSRQSSTTTRGSTSPQPELESFIPDELTDKPLKKKLFGGLGW